MDLQAYISEEIILKPGERKLIPTGLSIAIPENLEIQIRPRSGLAYQKRNFSSQYSWYNRF
jgi:dUTP pyrophosphatase